jgi:hypothetical protein
MPIVAAAKPGFPTLQANGFKVNDHVEADMSSVKQRLGVQPRLASCHTGVINGKFVEGHVPAEQVVALTQRNDLKGHRSTRHADGLSPVWRWVIAKTPIR